MTGATRPLRVCEVAKTLDVGGVETLLVSRLRRSSPAGPRYTVVCLRATTTILVEQLRSVGVEVIDLTRGPRLLVYARLALRVHRLRPDVLNVHSPMPAVALRLTTRLSRHRPVLVSTVHSTRYRRLTMMLNRLTGPIDDHTVAVSPQVSRAGTVAGARRVTVRVHGVDVREQRGAAARAGQVRREFRVPDGSFLVVNVANLRRPKNHRVLIDAAERVVAARPDACFLLVGSGPLGSVIAAELRRRHLGERVRMLGRVPGAGRLIAAADLLVLSSHHEGLPVVVMEALAAGVPVVATAVGGIPDLVDRGRNGLLVVPGCVAALTTALLTAMEPAVHRRLQAGAARVAAGIDIAGTATWFEEFYRAAVRGHR